MGFRERREGFKRERRKVSREARETASKSLERGSREGGIQRNRDAREVRERLRESSRAEMQC